MNARSLALRNTLGFFRKFTLGLWFGGAVWAHAQVPDEASIGNTVWELQPTSGVLSPRGALFLAPGGAWYSLSTTASLLQYGGVSSYRITGETTSTLQLGASTESAIRFRFSGIDSGTYQDARGSGSFRMTRAVVAQDIPLRNISSRAVLDGRQSTFVGFVVKGNARREVLVRAVGPSLSQFSVSNPAPNPALTVWQGNTRISSNQGWNGQSSILQAGIKVGAFPLLPLGRDSAVTVSLPPGDYVAQVEAGDVGGEVLVEVYFIN